MSTTKPRLTLMMEPEDFDLLKRAADLEGISMSKFVRNLFAAVEPGIRRTVRLGEAYRAASKGAQESLRRAVDTADEEVNEEVIRLEESAYALLDKLQKLADDVNDPPPSNQGGQVFPKSDVTRGDEEDTEYAHFAGI